MTEARPRLLEFEGLRALSIILLMVLHSEILGVTVFGIYLGPSANYVASFLLGSFFFLAGYFEESSLDRDRNQIFNHIKSKFLRIYPPFWLSLFLFVIVLGYSLKRFDAIVYLLNLQFIFSPNFVKQLLTLWYISVVVAYYFIFGILMLKIRSNLNLLGWSAVFFVPLYILHLQTQLIDPRFFDYYFIFLAGVYFSRFEEIRIRLFDLSLWYKIGTAFIGWLVYLLALKVGFDIFNPFYILAVDIFILTWVLMWLGIFRTKMGEWQIWAFISYASFFTYLYHRPSWELILKPFPPMSVEMTELARLFPASVIVMIVCYYLQKGYDRLLVLLHLRQSV